MSATEKQVQIAAQLYDMRAKAKRLLGEKYKTQMEELGRILKMTSDRDGKPAIVIAADVCKKRGLIGMDLLLVMAAAVELTEPSNALSSAAAVGGRLRRIVSPNGLIYLHHCCSHGTPSLFPSIFVPGQFLRKKVASSQEVI